MVRVFQLHWNLSGILAALLPRRLHNFKAIQVFQHLILYLGDFARPYNKTSHVIHRVFQPWFWPIFPEWYNFCIIRVNHIWIFMQYYYSPRNKNRGYIGFTLSVCPSVCPLTFRVCPVASTVQDGFFPYLVQMINSMRGCVAYDDPWPWPISSRSFGLDLENRVRSVASTVIDGFFLYLAQMMTITRGCVARYFFSESGNLNFWQI